MQQVLHGQATKLAIAHQFTEDILVAVHSLDSQTFERLLEDVAEILLQVRGSSLAQDITLDSSFLNLVEKERVGLSNGGPKAFVENVDQFK